MMIKIVLIGLILITSQIGGVGKDLPSQTKGKNKEALQKMQFPGNYHFTFKSDAIAYMNNPQMHTGSCRVTWDIDDTKGRRISSEGEYQW